MGRTLVLLLLATFLLPSCGKGPSAGECRTQYADLQQLLGENGNPGTDAMPKLTATWNALYEQFGTLAKTASGEDCDDVAKRKKTVGRVESIVYAAYDFDMVERLRAAERDLKHAESMRDYDPLPAELASSFAVFRSAAPRANAALSPQLSALDAVDPLDTSATEDAERDLKRAATADPDYQRCLEALVAIGEFELDEE